MEPKRILFKGLTRKLLDFLDPLFHSTPTLLPLWLFFLCKDKAEILCEVLNRAGGFPCGIVVKNRPAMQDTMVWSLGQEEPLEKEMTTHSSILAWRIPWTGEPDGLHSPWGRRVRHDWETNTFAGIELRFRDHYSFPGSSDGKVSDCNVGDLGLIPGSGRSPGEGNDNHSSILAWKSPWTEEPSRLQSMGSQRVGHDWVTSLHR